MEIVNGFLGLIVIIVIILFVGGIIKAIKPDRKVHVRCAICGRFCSVDKSVYEEGAKYVCGWCRES